MNDVIMKAYNEMSKAKYEADDALSKLDQMKKAYSEAKMKECIENILNVQKEDGTLTERDLKIFLTDLLNTVSSQYR